MLLVPAGIPLLCPLCFPCPRLLPKISKNDEKDFPRLRDKPKVPNSFMGKTRWRELHGKNVHNSQITAPKKVFSSCLYSSSFLLNHIYRNQQSAPPFIFDLPTTVTPPNSHDHHHPNTTTSACYHR